MARLLRILAFAAAVAVLVLTFAPVGAALGQLAYDFYRSLRAGGSSEAAASLIPLLGIDALALLVTFGVSLLGGVWLPSGLPHVFFGVFVPLSLGAMQARFFELSGDKAGLAETFGTWNFVALFALALTLASLGVYLARRMYERRHGAPPSA
jgi:hypothetical protein